jgi:ANTH domain
VGNDTSRGERIFLHNVLALFSSLLGYGALIRTYVQFILGKLKFHRLRPEFNGLFEYEEYVTLKGIDDPNEGCVPRASFINHVLIAQLVTRQSPTLWDCKIKSTHSRGRSSRTSNSPQIMSAEYLLSFPSSRKVGEYTDSLPACSGQCIEVRTPSFWDTIFNFRLQEQMTMMHWSHCDHDSVLSTTIFASSITSVRILNISQDLSTFRSLLKYVPYCIHIFF